MIYLPPPQPVLNKDIRISGDVEIHPTASIAPGVILQAAPDRRIVIGADVCIGMGVIINACQGSIEIESGAIIGSGVLIIGGCKIGNNACIGTAVTIFQASVDAMKVIEPGSVLGDRSRQISIDDNASSEGNAVGHSPTPAPNTVNQNKTASPTENNNYSPQASNNKTVGTDFWQSENNSPASSVEATVQPETKKNKNPVVGQVYINQLLVTLFPNNKDFSSQTKKLE